MRSLEHARYINQYQRQGLASILCHDLRILQAKKGIDWGSDVNRYYRAVEPKPKKDFTTGHRGHREQTEKKLWDGERRASDSERRRQEINVSNETW